MLDLEKTKVEIDDEIDRFSDFVKNASRNGVIFLDGKFGVGKTYFIKEFESKNCQNKYIYINSYSSYIGLNYIDYLYNELLSKRSTLEKIVTNLTKAFPYMLLFLLILICIFNFEDSNNTIVLLKIAIPISIIIPFFSFLISRKSKSLSYQEKVNYIKKRVEKGNFILILDDFDRLYNSSFKEESFKILDFLYDLGSKIIVIGDISNIENQENSKYIEKYLDYKYPFPREEIVSILQNRLISLIESKLDGEYDKYIYENIIKKIFFSKDLSFREIKKVLYYIEKMPSNINSSEYFIAAFYYAIDYLVYQYIFYLLSNKRRFTLIFYEDYANGMKELGIEESEYKLLNDYLFKFIESSTMGSSQIKIIYPDSFTPKFRTVVSYPKLYYINNVENDQISFSELCQKIDELIKLKQSFYPIMVDLNRFKTDFHDKYSSDYKFIVDFHIEILSNKLEKSLFIYQDIDIIFFLTDWDNLNKYEENHSEDIPRLFDYNLNIYEEYSIFRYLQARPLSLGNNSTDGKQKYAEYFNSRYSNPEFIENRTIYLYYLMDYAKYVSVEGAIELLNNISEAQFEKYIELYRKLRKDRSLDINYFLIEGVNVDNYNVIIREKVTSYCSINRIDLYDRSPLKIADEKIV